MKKLTLLLSISLFLTCIYITGKSETQAISNNHSHQQNYSHNQAISNNHSHQQNYSHNQEVKNLSEYPILNKHFDVNNYKTQTVTDNSYKRIILFKNNKGNVKFKSIYIKNTDRLKVISTNKGLIYNGIIK